MNYETALRTCEVCSLICKQKTCMILLQRVLSDGYWGMTEYNFSRVKWEGKIFGEYSLVSLKSLFMSMLNRSSSSGSMESFNIALKSDEAFWKGMRLNEFFCNGNWVRECQCCLIWFDWNLPSSIAIPGRFCCSRWHHQHHYHDWNWWDACLTKRLCPNWLMDSTIAVAAMPIDFPHRSCAMPCANDWSRDRVVAMHSRPANQIPKFFKTKFKLSSFSWISFSFRELSSISYLIRIMWWIWRIRCHIVDIHSDTHCWKRCEQIGIILQATLFHWSGRRTTQRR